MADLNEIVSFLELELDTENVPDYPVANNGLQLKNSGQVTKVAAAVDASLPVIRKAINLGADLLVVHHGLFWQGAKNIVGAQYEKLSESIHADLAIYSSHIPLDVHSQLGNNMQLAKAIGMTSPEAYHAWKGILLGVRQDMDLEFEEFIGRVEGAVDDTVHFCRGRLEPTVGSVGIITGAAGSEIEAMAEQGIDTFITGEGPHWSYSLAEELGVNLIYAGHYATETFGVKSVVKLLEKKFDVSSVFVDHPTGL